VKARLAGASTVNSAVKSRKHQNFESDKKDPFVFLLTRAVFQKIGRKELVATDFSGGAEGIDGKVERSEDEKETGGSKTFTCFNGDEKSIRRNSEKGTMTLPAGRGKAVVATGENYKNTKAAEFQLPKKPPPERSLKEDSLPHPN